MEGGLRRLALIGLFTAAAGCTNRAFEAFADEEARLQCELDAACTDPPSMAGCDDPTGRDLDRCEDFHPARGDACLDDLQELLDELDRTEDPALREQLCLDRFPASCADAVTWNSGRRGCQAIEGRPLVQDGRLVLADLIDGPRRSSQSDLVDEIGDQARARAERHWRRAARTEHASIAAFESLAHQLVSLGAPAALVERAHVAARDESRHAAACLRIAGVLSGRTLAFGPLPPIAARPRLTWSEIAVESLLDGCIGEGAAAVRAATAARAARPSIRRVLAPIAAEELSHTTLAWAILGEALRRQPDAARTVIRALQDHELQVRARLREIDVRDGVAPLGVLETRHSARLELELITTVVAPTLCAVLRSIDRPDARATA